MDIIIEILQNYGEIAHLGLEAVFGIAILCLLAGMLKQIKRLNASLKSITGNMQAYFDVILTEEEESDSQQHIEKEEEMRAKIAELKKKEEEEQIFNAVLQEYFS